MTRSRRVGVSVLPRGVSNCLATASLFTPAIHRRLQFCTMRTAFWSFTDTKHETLRCFLAMLLVAHRDIYAPGKDNLGSTICYFYDIRRHFDVKITTNNISLLPGVMVDSIILIALSSYFPCSKQNGYAYRKKGRKSTPNEQICRRKRNYIFC